MMAGTRHGGLAPPGRYNRSLTVAARIRGRRAAGHDTPDCRHGGQARVRRYAMMAGTRHGGLAPPGRYFLTSYSASITSSSLPPGLAASPTWTSEGPASGPPPGAAPAAAPFAAAAAL